MSGITSMFGALAPLATAFGPVGALIGGAVSSIAGAVDSSAQQPAAQQPNQQSDAKNESMGFEF